MTGVGTVDCHEGGTLGDILVSALERFPDRIAFEQEGAPAITYQGFGDMVGLALALFRQRGLKHGDAIVQLSGNRAETFAIMVAAYLKGLRSTTLNALGGLDDQRFIIADAGAKLVIVDPSYGDRVPALREDGGPRWLAHGLGIGGVPDFWSLAMDLDAEPLIVEARAGDIVRVAYTGGTTGRPKGVMLSHRSLVAQAVGTMLACRGVNDQRFLCAAPISHAAGALIVPVLSAGGTVILQRRFEPGTFLQAVERHGATLTMLVPTMIAALMDHPTCARTNLGSLELILYGAAPMAPDRIRKAMETFGPILVQSYGQTEAPGTVLLLDRDDHRHHDPIVLSSAGRPYPGVKVALFDDHDLPVQRGEVGELCVRGALVMDGYQGQPEQTAVALRGDWLRTGDLARQDDHGYYHIVDRKKDMIISGGFNVYPKEIEDVIAAIPGVAEVAVIGIPDDRWGEAVMAIVVPEIGRPLDEEGVKAFVRARKGAVAVPKTVEVRDALPLTPLGKIDKKALRAIPWSGRDRAIN